MRFQAVAQAEDGGWPGPSGASDAAITALVAQPFISIPSTGRLIRSSSGRCGLSLRISSRTAESMIQAGLANYSTSVALMMLAAADDPRWIARLMQPGSFSRTISGSRASATTTAATSTRAPWYGGAGYGQHRRPDLSNTQMMLEALHQSGLPLMTRLIRRPQVRPAVPDVGAE